MNWLKAMLKRWVFNARRKVGCESMSLMSVGRLFQMSGPLTENAHRPNYVFVQRMTADLDLVVDDRSWRWCALRLNVTRFLRNGGEHWWKILDINVTTLKVIQNFIWSQWICLRAGVMWDRRLRPRMSQAAASWTLGRVLMQEDRLVQSYSSQYEIWDGGWVHREWKMCR